MSILYMIIYVNVLFFLFVHVCSLLFSDVFAIFGELYVLIWNYWRLPLSWETYLRGAFLR